MFSRNSFYVAYWADLESILLSLASAVVQRLEILSLKKKKKEALAFKNFIVGKMQPSIAFIIQRLHLILVNFNIRCNF